MSAVTFTARLKDRYLNEVRPELIGRFGYSSVMQAPRIEKIVLNMGVGEAKQDSKALEAARSQLATIAGQRPNIRRARKSIAAFKLREGMPVGVTVTLRGERSYEFLDRLTSIAIPRIRDFRGLNPRSFDGRGNYSMGVREQIIFPEVDFDAIDQVRGLDITITTSARTDVEAFALLNGLGMPFARDGRPKEFGGDSEETIDGHSFSQAPAPGSEVSADDEQASALEAEDAAEQTVAESEDLADEGSAEGGEDSPPEPSSALEGGSADDSDEERADQEQESETGEDEVLTREEQGEQSHSDAGEDGDKESMS